VTRVSLSNRKGNNKNDSGSWPETDGRGCGYCGAIGQGPHGDRCVQAALWIAEDGSLIENNGFRMKIKEHD
jgi:hypothetical protein